MSFLYTIGILLYGVLISVLAPFNSKAGDWKKGRRNWKENLKLFIGKDEWIWFHCSSMGEYEDCHEVLQAKVNEGKYKVLLTFFSPSGYNVINKKKPCDLVFYMPLDLKWNVRSFLNIVQPKEVYFSRSELWLNYLNELKKRSIPTYLLSMSLLENSGFLKWPLRSIFKKCIQSFTHIFCQTEGAKELLASKFGMYAVTITGNSRFDRIYQNARAMEYEEVAQFVNEEFCVIIGSSLPNDEANLLKCIENFKDRPIKWIIVPHDIHDAEINAIVDQDKSRRLRFSKMSHLNQNHNVLIIDFVGGLKHMYQYADLAIVGGGFDPIGIHNIIEPSVFGLPTTFGPNHRNYKEALDLMEMGASTVHNNHEELSKWIEGYMNNSPSLELKKKIEEYVLSNTGASQKILDRIKELR